MKVGFIGLGNVGGKLARSLLRNNFDLTVRDLDKNLTQTFKDLGANIANSAKELAEQVDLIITCLPSPKICAEVMEASITSAQILGDGKHVIIKSTCSASSFAEFAIFAPKSLKVCVRFLSKSLTVKSKLFLNKLLANLPPTFPKPIKPTFINFSLILMNI